MAAVGRVDITEVNRLLQGRLLQLATAFRNTITPPLASEIQVYQSYDFSNYDDPYALIWSVSSFSQEKVSTGVNPLLAPAEMSVNIQFYLKGATNFATTDYSDLNQQLSQYLVNDLDGYRGFILPNTSPPGSDFIVNMSATQNNIDFDVENQVYSGSVELNLTINAAG